MSLATHSLLPVCLCIGLGAPLGAAIAEQVVDTSFEGTDFKGTVVWNDASDASRPGLLMVPNWMGPTAASLDKAKAIADMGYVVYMADLYGVDTRPQNSDEAAAAAGAVRADRPLMRRRMNHQLEVLAGLAASTPLDPERLGAIGFCFGGGCVLELARSGAELGGVVSFHGNLDTPDPNLAEQITTPILVLHGADDPFVPQEQVQAFMLEMAKAPVDVRFVALAGAVHSFTNPDAAMAGKAEYDARANEVAFAEMRHFFTLLLAQAE